MPNKNPAWVVTSSGKKSENMSSPTKQIAFCTIGTMLEWYDFSLFSSLAAILSQIFFPRANHFAAMMSVFAVFASGFIMRPIGAIFFGHLADKLGRKSTLQITIFIMALTTTAIGCIPPLINAAAFILVLCRLAQGFAVSGEYPSGVTLLAEHNNQKRKGFISSFGIFSSVIGFVFGTLVCAITNKFLGQESMLSWGWRIPFLLGAPIGLLGYWIRKSLLESEEFHSVKKAGGLSTIPLVQLVKKHRKEFVVVFTCYVLSNLAFYVNFIYFSNYTLNQHKTDVSQAMYLGALTMFMYSMTILLFGWLSDYVGRKRLMMIACINLILLTYPLFHIILTGSASTQLFAQSCLSLLIGMFVGPLAAMSAEYFPVNVRATGLGVALSSSAAIFGSTAPLLCMELTKITGNAATSSGYIILAALFAFVAITVITE